MTMLSVDCLYRVQRACDCSFLFWHRVVIPIYLQDMFETVTDTHRIHVSRTSQTLTAYMWVERHRHSPHTCSRPSRTLTAYMWVVAYNTFLGLLIFTVMTLFVPFPLSVVRWLDFLKLTWAQSVHCELLYLVLKRQHFHLPYFFYIFDHLKIINFSADRIIGITPKLTENLEPNTNCIPNVPVYVCILIGKVRRCRTHITWVTFGYYRDSFYDIRIKLLPFSFVLRKTIAEE